MNALINNIFPAIILTFGWLWMAWSWIAHPLFMRLRTEKRQKDYLRRIEEYFEQVQKDMEDHIEYHVKHLRDIPEETVKEGDRAVIGNDHYERVQNYWELSETVSDVFEKMEQDQLDTLKSLIEQGVMTPNEYRQKIGLKPVDPIESIKNEELPQNCPNCGAPVFDSVCPYCDTRFTHKAKTDENLIQIKLENTKRVEELYEEAIKAFKSYHA